MTELFAYAGVAQGIGDRLRQEDAALIHNAHGNEPTIAVLSDGMGGHADGDLASRIITREMFGELFLAAARPERFSQHSSQVFRAALGSANARLKRHISKGHIGSCTGGTLLSVAVFERQLFWVSVGDSLLYHLRANTMQRLNEDHSMATHLEWMVANEELDFEAAKNHPNRHCLTSAITGGEIAKIDCPDTGQTLESGDVLVIASDGICVLPEARVRAILRKNRKRDSDDIARALLENVLKMSSPGQDNTSIIVIKITDALQNESVNRSDITRRVGGLSRINNLFRRGGRLET